MEYAYSCENKWTITSYNNEGKSQKYNGVLKLTDVSQN